MPRLMPPKNTDSNRLRLRLWLWVFGFAFALLLSQSLGQLHAVHHGGLASASHATAAHEAEHEHGFLEQLFSDHSSNTGCRLYDQLGDGHAMPAVVLLVMPGFLPLSTVANFQGQALARWAALFDARGPPLSV